MTKSNGTPGNDYDSYAQFCLKLATQIQDRPSRLMLREMAAQWLKLLDADPIHSRHDGLDGLDGGHHKGAGAAS